MQIIFDDEFDLLIIGGGAIGSNLALYATLCGLKTLIIEQNDFSSGSSSKSTKLLHGGVRYLEQAIKNCDTRQFNLVNEALNERHYFLNNANFLSKRISLITPIKKWYELPYYYTGLKIYDFISKNKSIGKTSYLSKNYLKRNIPILNNNIKNAVKYYDGSFNDSKLNIAIIQTAQKYGAIVKNYTKFDAFIYKNDKLCGVRILNKNENTIHNIKSKCIINATGHYVDNIRKLDNEKAKEIAIFSKGSHIVISNKYLNLKEGIIIPKTKDGRVLFILPWQNHILIGTTDISCNFSNNQNITNEEIQYLIMHLNEYFNIDIKTDDILSAWTGIRTLLKKDSNTKDIVREHIFEKSKSNLISIAGGKWTTSRKIAHECIEFIFKENLLENKSNFSFKIDVRIYGSYNNKDELLNILKSYDLDKNTIIELINNYGENSLKVLELENFEKIHDKLPYIKAEILYCIKNEYVQKPLDFLARRVRLAFLDKNLCFECLAFVTKTICEYFDYDKTKYNNLLNEAKRELNEFF